MHRGVGVAEGNCPDAAPDAGSRGPALLQTSPGRRNRAHPPPERPVLLWTMRVSTALAVVAFTVMVAGNVSGLFEGGGGDGGRAASEDSMAYDSPDFSPTSTPAPMMEDEPEDAMMAPTPQAMMEAEPDIIPKSTPMMMAEPTATMEFTAMPEPTAMPDEEAESNKAAFTLEGDDSWVADAPLVDPEPTPAPALTATPRPRPTAAPIPSPTLVPRETSAPTPAPPTPFVWTRSIDDEEGGNGVVLGLTVGLGTLAGALAMGTIYLTVRRAAGGGVGRILAPSKDPDLYRRERGLSGPCLAELELSSGG